MCNRCLHYTPSVKTRSNTWYRLSCSGIDTWFSERVFSRWQGNRQSVCKLARSYIAPPSAIGLMWSTSVPRMEPHCVHFQPSRSLTNGLTRSQRLRLIFGFNAPHLR